MSFLLNVTDNLLDIVNNVEKVNSEIILNIFEDTYIPTVKNDDKQFFRNDWTVLAFRAFKYLKDNNHHSEINDICIIGTGSGFDAIGAIEIFSPKRIVITDFPKSVSYEAENNIYLNLKPNLIPKITSVGALYFDSPFFNNSKFDLIYENLPNLPEHNVYYNDQPVNASFIPQYDAYINDVPHVYATALLSSHYTLLKQAKEHLNNDGSIISSIGGRVDFNLIEKMFDELGYDYDILVYDVKKQNEADTNLPVYSHSAEIWNTKFNFYLFENILKQLDESKIGYDKCSGFKDNIKKVKEILENCKLPAAQALKEFKSGKAIGHEVYLFLLKLKK